jgi:hypothetical protein
MRDFALIWLLLNTKTGKVILTLFITFVLVSVLKWWTIPVVILFIFAVWIQIEVDKKQSQKYQSKSNKTKFLTKKARLTQEQINYEYSKIKEKHPDAILNQNSARTDVRAYWLTIGKGGNRKDEVGNRSFKIKFAFADDLTGLIVTITNTGDDTINIDWCSFAINRNRVHIDGVVYVSYEQSGLLEPGMVVTKLIQRHSDYFSGKFRQMFDFEQINIEEQRFDITFDILDGDNERKTYNYDIYTTLRIIN